MKINVFKKKVTPKNGNKQFIKYVTTMVKKDGTNVYCDVSFGEGVDIPKEFPCVVVFDRTKANLSAKKRDYTDKETGEIKEYTRRTLWINEIQAVENYIDHSLDDFE